MAQALPDMLKYKLTDQTSVGLPVDTSMIPSLASDKTAIALNDKLYKWYMETLPLVSDPNTKKIYDNVLSVVNRSGRTQKRVKDLSLDIVNRMEAIIAKESTIDPATRPTIQAIDRAIKSSVLPTRLEVKTGGGSNRIANFIETYNKDSADARGDKEKLRTLLTQYKSDPIVSPDSEAITATDRIIFIAMTFVLRSICLYLVEWAVNTFMVRSFQDAFKMYLVCYICVFALWAILVNASNSLFLKMMFYYISSDPHGFGRIIVHFLVQLIILPIPLIVKTKGFEYTQEEYTYEARKKTMNVLSYFTFFIWTMTSVIAVRY